MANYELYTFASSNEKKDDPGTGGGKTHFYELLKNNHLMCKFLKVVKDNKF